MQILKMFVYGFILTEVVLLCLSAVSEEPHIILFIYHVQMLLVCWQKNEEAISVSHVLFRSFTMHIK